MSALLSSKQAGQYLGVSDDFIHARVKAGELACYRFGKLLKFSTADLDDFAERQRVPAAVAPIPVPRRRAGGLSYEASVAALKARDIDALRAAR